MCKCQTGRVSLRNLGAEMVFQGVAARNCAHLPISFVFLPPRQFCLLVFLALALAHLPWEKLWYGVCSIVIKKIEGTFLPLWYSKYFPHSKIRNTFEVCGFALHVWLLYLPIVRSPFKTCLAAQRTASEVTRSKNTIRDGGSTALYTAFTVYTVCTVWHCFHCLYYSNCLSLLKQKHVCLSILLRKVRTLWEWVYGLLTKKWDGMDG